VGPKTEAVLHRLGIKTIGELRERGETFLAARLGDQGRALHALSLGEDDREVLPDRQAKSVGAEDTFSEDTLDPEFLRATLHGQAWRVGRRLRRGGLAGRVVELKLKDGAFKIIHRQTTLDEPTDDGQAIFRAALALLEKAAPTIPLRLIGVAASDFAGPGVATRPIQPDLFAAPKPARPKRTAALNTAIDRINEKFGDKLGGDAIRPLDLVEQTSGTRPRITGVRPPAPNKGRR
jgi:DNA polymerase-4